MLNSKIHEILFRIIKTYGLKLDYSYNQIREIEYYEIKKDYENNIFVEVAPKYVYISINSDAEQLCCIQVSDETKVDYIFKNASLCIGFDFEDYLYRLSKILGYALGM